MRNLSMIFVILLIGVGCYFYFNPHAELKIFTPDTSNNTQEGAYYPNNSRFSSSIPMPGWYDQADLVELNSSEEISKLWQSKERCCIDKGQLELNNQEFFKSCYNFIDKFESTSQDIETERGVVKCLWLMDGAADKITKKEIREYLIKNYIDHNASTDNCSNCSPADTIIRAAKDLSRNYKNENNPEAAIKLIEIVLDKRDGEISDWVELDALETLARLYMGNNPTAEQIARIEKGLSKFAIDKEERRLKRNYNKLEKSYSKLKSQR